MDGMVNLTAIWKDAGLQKHQRAGVWAKKDGVEAIKAAASDFGLSVEEVFFSTEGRGRASWGHPRVAEAYALYAAAELRRMRETRTFDISDERWLGLVQWRGYEISDYGRVRSYWSNNGGLTDHPKLVGCYVKDSGHHEAALYRNRSRRPTRIGVHRLVLEAFVGPCPEGMECCHNDGNPANNKLGNLRWDTNSANQRDKLRHGTQRNVVLSEGDIPSIWARLVAGEGLTSIGRDYGVDAPVIWCIKVGRTWEHITSILPGFPLVSEGSGNQSSIYISDHYAASEREIWEPIPDWPAYRASTFGRVMTCWERVVGGRRGEFRLSDNWRLLNLAVNRFGYLTFTASNGPGTSKTLKAHRVVLETFAGPCPPGMVACHIDDNRQNNHASNLRWDTHRENVKDRFRHAKERTAKLFD